MKRDDRSSFRKVAADEYGSRLDGRDDAVCVITYVTRRRANQWPISSADAAQSTMLPACKSRHLKNHLASRLKPFALSGPTAQKNSLSFLQKS